MKRRWKWNLLLIVVLLFGGCSTALYTIDSTIVGIIEDIKIEGQFFADDEFLVIQEDDQEGNSLYEIPVNDSDAYEIGQKVEVVIFSNTATDDWDLDNMKFEIEVIEE